MGAGTLKPLTRISDILDHADAKAFIEKSATQMGKTISGEDIMKLAGKSGQIGGQLGMMIGTKAGIKSQSAREVMLEGAPYAYAVTALMTALPAQGLKIKEMSEDASSCRLVCDTPSSMFAMPGDAVFTLRPATTGTALLVQTTFYGQMFDWGHGKRLADEIVSRTQGHTRTLATLNL